MDFKLKSFPSPFHPAQYSFSVTEYYFIHTHTTVRCIPCLTYNWTYSKLLFSVTVIVINKSYILTGKLSMKNFLILWKFSLNIFLVWLDEIMFFLLVYHMWCSKINSLVLCTFKLFAIWKILIFLTCFSTFSRLFFRFQLFRCAIIFLPVVKQRQKTIQLTAYLILFEMIADYPSRPCLNSLYESCFFVH